METIPNSNTSETIVDLPISKIKENPDNPRHVITPEMIETMAASLKAVRLKNPIKVRKLGVRSEELGVDGENQDQQPTDDGGYEYELISGHIRLAGAKKLGWETIKARVLDLTPQEALLEAILDNWGQEMTWLDRYQSIESLMKADPNQTQQEVGDKLEIDRSVVSRALKLLELLNTPSREVICENFTKPEGYQVPESCVRRLTDLAKSSKTQKTGNDPKNTQNDLQNLIERALGVVFRHEMTEAQVGKMVAKILKTGVSPEEYEAGLGQSIPDSPEDPNAALWEPLPESVKIHKTPQGYKLAWTLSEAEAPVAVYGAMAWLEHLKYDAKLGTPDLRYMKALPKMTHQNKEAYAQEHEARTKAEERKRVEDESRKAAAEAKAQQKAEAKTQREAQKQAKAEIKEKLGVRSEELGVNSKNQMQESERPGEEALSGTEMASSSTPAYSAGTPRNDRPETAPALNQGGILGAVVQAVKNRVGSNTGEVESNIAGAIVNDAQRAANTLVRQGMKKVFKDLF